MEWTPNTSNASRIAAWVLLVVTCTGCGSPMIYHFKHYHSPFEAIARSNKTYFHSQQTGRIIPKEPCATYCEPGCFGYEPTSWTHWPSECADNCPVFGEVVSDEAASNQSTGIISDGAVIIDGGPMPGQPTISQPLQPIPARPYLDELRVPSIPADVESAVPSPSDSTKAPKPARITPVKEDALQPDRVDRIQITLRAPERDQDELKIRKVVPVKTRETSIAEKLFVSKKPVDETIVLGPKAEPTLIESEPVKTIPPTTMALSKSPEETSAAIKSTNVPSAVTNGMDTMPIEIAPLNGEIKKRASKKLASASVVGAELNRIAIKELSSSNKFAELPVPAPAKSTLHVKPKLPRQQVVATMKVSDGLGSTLRFTAESSARPAVRISAANDGSTTIRFR